MADIHELGPSGHTNRRAETSHIIHTNGTDSPNPQLTNEQIRFIHEAIVHPGNGAAERVFAGISDPDTWSYALRVIEGSSVDDPNIKPDLSKPDPAKLDPDGYTF